MDHMVGNGCEIGEDDRGWGIPPTLGPGAMGAEHPSYGVCATPGAAGTRPGEKRGREGVPGCRRHSGSPPTRPVLPEANQRVDGGGEMPPPSGRGRTFVGGEWCAMNAHPTAGWSTCEGLVPKRTLQVHASSNQYWGLAARNIRKVREKRKKLMQPFFFDPRGNRSLLGSI